MVRNGFCPSTVAMLLLCAVGVLDSCKDDLAKALSSGGRGTGLHPSLGCPFAQSDSLLVGEMATTTKH